MNCRTCCYVSNGVEPPETLVCGIHGERKTIGQDVWVIGDASEFAPYRLYHCEGCMNDDPIDPQVRCWSRSARMFEKMSKIKVDPKYLTAYRLGDNKDEI